MQTPEFSAETQKNHWSAPHPTGRANGCGPAGSQGFTLLEFVVVITLISVVSTVFVDRLLYYSEMAEKTAMEQVLGVLQSATTMRSGALFAHAQNDRIEAMPKENPMKWLAEVPRNYLGEYYSPDINALQPGSWYYDLHARELVYLVDRGRRFITRSDGCKWIRFRVELVYDDLNAEPKPAATPKPTKGGGKTDVGVAAGVVIKPTHLYQWF